MGEPRPVSFLHSLVAGGIAGTAVDTVLFPLDTIKTRLQSSHGFIQSGGFKGIYRGLSSVVIGSAPGAALFFSTYESVKSRMGTHATFIPAPLHHMTAAACAEVMACLVRVPTELVKQRMQTFQYNSVPAAVSSIVKSDGIFGMWRGFHSLIMREIPFAIIQFPLYERFKAINAGRQGRENTPLEAAACGSLAGGLAGAVTTPLDVTKTRIMLAKAVQGSEYRQFTDTLKRIAAEEGVARLYSGVVPRTMWITLGGFVFFGVYENAKRFLAPAAPIGQREQIV